MEVSPHNSDQSASPSQEQNDDENRRVRRGRQKKQSDFPIGFKVLKKFKNRYFEGRVTGGPRIDDGVPLWSVLYEDGDMEEMERRELLKYQVVDIPSEEDASSSEEDGASSDKESDEQKNEANYDNEEHEITSNLKPTAAKRNKESTTDDDTIMPSSNKKANNKREENDNAIYGKLTSHGPKRCEASIIEYEKALQDLKRRMGTTDKEAREALDKLEPPYGLNEAMRLIHEGRKDPESYVPREKFNPGPGMRIRKNFGGQTYHGEVIGEADWCECDETGEMVKTWRVRYDEDGLEDDLEFHELQRFYAGRPIRKHPVRGRQLCALELFSGCGIVSQEFAEHKWRVRSIDNSPESNATDHMDIMKLKYRDIGFVPDFIWASPPCFTYSLLAGGKHRKNEPGMYEQTPEARENNRLLAQMYAIMRWALSKNPHLIVVIENPRGLLKAMPLMKEIVDKLGLYRTTVDYCAFGRDDMKPTNLWTNSFRLLSTLSEYRCETMCPYHGGLHPVGVRSNGHQYNAAAIPDALAEEVADEVFAIFQERRIRKTPEATMTDEEIEAFDRMMKSGHESDEQSEMME